MPQVFSRNFQKLRILNLSRNKIHFMFLGIGFPTDSYGRVSKKRGSRLPLLRSLDLSYNEIKDLAFPFDYPLVPSLATLNLSYCQIDYLPIKRQNPFRCMPSLLYLDLSHNNIMHLSQTSFVVNQKLNLIDLSGNKLVEWPVFDYCEIRFLNLSSNSYTSLKKLSLNHSRIEYIDLSWNRISEWNETDIFYYPKGLESSITKVNLSYSAISSLSEEMFISFKALGGIDIGNSSADCVHLLRWRGSEHIKNIYSLGRRNHLSCNVTTQEDPSTRITRTSALRVNENVFGTALMLPLVLLCIVAIYSIVFRLRYASYT
ncbi:chaoptin-like [Anabrus simplex]|uniref:chaoptin-like n=1 Tax=Anabrus simplex TaxID=316456 RepID=UPI0035A2F9E2